MHELMFQAGVKGMSERSELIPCNNYYSLTASDKRVWPARLRRSYDKLYL